MSRTGGSATGPLVNASAIGALPPVGYLERWAEMSNTTSKLKRVRKERSMQTDIRRSMVTVTTIFLATLALGQPLATAQDADVVAFLKKLTTNRRLWPEKRDFKVFADILKAVDGQNGAAGIWFCSDGNTVGFPGATPTDDLKQWIKPFAAYSDNYGIRKVK
jgi:hypothetical protein